MSSYDSIIAFAERASTLERLDFVILNAAITRFYFHLNPSTGYEEIIQVNYLSTILLAIKLFLLPKERDQLCTNPVA
jgi:NAD(P)-dependent dehydrogenase (short-subunit alcohol dehydrogenase family)